MSGLKAMITGGGYEAACLAGGAAVVLFVVLHFALAGRRRIGQGRAEAVATPGTLARLAFLATLLAVAALAVTAYVPLLVRGGPMRGWLLLAHSSIAGLLVVALPALCILAAGFWRFRCCEGASACYGEGRKLSFWLMAVAGLVSMASMLAMMLPVTSTECQEVLLDLHRYSGLGLVAFSIINVYLGLLPRVVA